MVRKFYILPALVYFLIHIPVGAEKPVEPSIADLLSDFDPAKNLAIQLLSNWRYPVLTRMS